MSPRRHRLALYRSKNPFTPPLPLEPGVEETFASALGVLTVARILGDVGDHPGIENALAIVGGIKAAVEIDIGASEVQTDLFSDLLQRFETLGEQHHIRFIDRSHGDGR
jgi:hypothetical protein